MTKIVVDQPSPCTNAFDWTEGYPFYDLRYVNVGGDTMSGPLLLPGDPASPLEAATKQYVDANSGDIDTVWVGVDSPVDPITELWYDTDATASSGGSGGSGGMSGPTVDTGEEFRIIMFSDGTVRAIPVSSGTPGTPSAFARTVRVNSVNLTWDPVPGASSYIVFRDGGQYATPTANSYRDISVTVGQIYVYTVVAVASTGLRSDPSVLLSAFIDPALNVAPTVEVRAWPTTVAVGNRAIIRVNAADVDAQLLALTLGTDAGSLVATADPSVWILTPS